MIKIPTPRIPIGSITVNGALITIAVIAIIVGLFYYWSKEST